MVILIRRKKKETREKTVYDQPMASQKKYSQKALLAETF